APLESRNWARRRASFARKPMKRSKAPRRPPQLSKVSWETEQLVHRRFVRRRERILFELVALHPAKILHVDRAKLARDDLSIVEVELDGVVLVGMVDEGNELANFDLHRQTMKDLSFEGIGVAFARLDASTGKLPQERQHGRRPALSDEVAPFFGNDGGDDA